MLKNVYSQIKSMSSIHHCLNVFNAHFLFHDLAGLNCFSYFSSIKPFSNMAVKSSIFDLRRATDSDYEPLLELIHLVIKQSYSIIYPAGVVDYFLKYHNTESIRKNATEGTTLVASTKYNIVGTIHLIGNTMGGLYVHPKFQAKGLGTMLINTMIKMSKEKKLDQIILDSTLNAKKLYTSLGFQTIEFTYCMAENGDRLYYFKMKKDL